jgi:hypothetical protein
VRKDWAIPTGTFVEGKIIRMAKRDATRFEGLTLEFNRLAFPNGYAVEPNGSVINTKRTAPATDPGSRGATPGFPCRLR